MSFPDVAGAAVLGVVLGVVTGLPIGVVNVAIVEAATRGERRFAIEIGLGGALADAVHAAIAFLGVGRVANHVPQRIAIATGVGIGSALWFTLLARFFAALPAEHGSCAGFHALQSCCSPPSPSSESCARTRRDWYHSRHARRGVADLARRVLHAGPERGRAVRPG